MDAGGRYGLHPTWKPFRGEILYVLFEPDTQEAARLQIKYSHRREEINIEALALADHPGTLSIDFFRNRAMSSSAVRAPLSALFAGERAGEVEIVDSVDVPATTIDAYCSQRAVQADFLKLDTEGTELEILRGAEDQLSSGILGVRAEVNFERTFVDKPLFGEIHDFMLERDFYLLNLDYDGRGEYQNDFARIDGRFGILASTDAVWLRRKAYVLRSQSITGALETSVLKYAAFCFHNFAPDVAIDVLLEGRRVGADYLVLRGSRLLSHVDSLLHHHLYSLKWIPGQSLTRSERVYFEILGRTMKTRNAFMESAELNPD